MKSILIYALTIFSLVSCGSKLNKGSKKVENEDQATGVNSSVSGICELREGLTPNRETACDQNFEYQVAISAQLFNSINSQKGSDANFDSTSAQSLEEQNQALNRQYCNYECRPSAVFAQSLSVYLQNDGSLATQQVINVNNNLAAQLSGDSHSDQIDQSVNFNYGDQDQQQNQQYQYNYQQNQYGNQQYQDYIFLSYE